MELTLTGYRRSRGSSEVKGSERKMLRPMTAKHLTRKLHELFDEALRQGVTHEHERSKIIHAIIGVLAKECRDEEAWAKRITKIAEFVL